MAKSKFQNYVIQTINRQQIKNASYNPRVIDEDAERRLRAEIERNGLVTAICWNKRTGNIVGGHQRIKQLDMLEHTQDYDLDVCVIDVDERQEAILNIELNNASIQGDWDLEKLASIAMKLDIDLTVDTSFTDFDVDFMFDGDDRFSKLFEDDTTEKVKGHLHEIKQNRSDGEERLAGRNNISYYTVIIFEDEEHRSKFMHDINLPIYEEYVTEEQVRRLANASVNENAENDDFEN